MPKKLSHYDSAGRARMVDVSGKSATRRTAQASGFVAIKPEVLASLPNNPKGDPLEVEVRVCENGVAITSTTATHAETGVEMEALTAVSIAALTLYDMLKAADKGIEIREIMLERKTGGKSGDYTRGR